MVTALKFGAAWCSMCVDLDRDVIGPQGDALFEGVELRSVDADADRALAERYAVLELPTLVVVRDDVETGRVVGYASAASWVGAAKAALASDDPIPALREAAADGDPEALRELGEALLSRDAGEGIATLERVSWSDTPAAASALWALGRFHHRVRRDPATARFIWQQLERRFPDDDLGARWWYAKAQAELGRVDLGSLAFARRVAEAPEDAGAISDWARFAGRHGYEPAREAIRAAATAAAGRVRRDARDELEELIMDLSRPFE